MIEYFVIIKIQKVYYEIFYYGLGFFLAVFCIFNH